MPSDPSRPLLRLAVGAPRPRDVGTPKKPPKPAAYSVQAQRAAFGPKFGRLAQILARDDGAIQLRGDPNALAPERLIVFEVRGSIGSFVEAIRKVPGLELVDEEELVGDDLDKAPVAYLVVPDGRALRSIISLWERWSAGQTMRSGFTPWRDVFATLKDVRPWGPGDRLQRDDRDAIATELALKVDGERIRLEIEMVYRTTEGRANETEAQLVAAIGASGGRVLARCRITEIAYHAMLTELPVPAARGIIGLSAASIAGLDAVMYIRPQSVATTIEVSEAELTAVEVVPPTDPAPILALVDGVPVSGHALLRGAISVDDQFGLEPLTQLSERVHGTAMASLIICGDLNKPEQRLRRSILSVPVLGPEDQFPDHMLIVDMLYRAILSMREGVAATAPGILIVNLSLGNSRKLFQGRMSAWARLIDRMAYRFGILFIVSAGNHKEQFSVPNFARFSEFEDAADAPRAEGSMAALGQLISQRRLLSPSECMNGITVGAANIDAVTAANRRGAAMSVDPFPNIVMANPSSALGPGFANCVKPDVLMAGSREHLGLVASGDDLLVKPTGAARAHGLKVAAPPRGGAENFEHYTNGSSASAALASRTCHQIYEALEEVYGNAFTSLSHAHRATLLKALIVHTACWPQKAADLILKVMGPADNKQHVRQRDNIRRFLGFGLVDADAAVACAGDRATFWASGSLERDKAVAISVPIPPCINGRSIPHAFVATLAWLTPVQPGRQSYRSVRLVLTDPDEMETLRVGGAKAQPDMNQSRKGTVFTRRWEGGRAPAVGPNHTITLTVQRQPDQGTPIDEPIAFGLAATITMPGVNEVYDQVRAILGVPSRILA